MSKKIKDRKNTGKRIKPSLDSSSTSTNDRHPAFCFRYLNKNYSLEKYKDKEMSALFAKKLEQLSGMNWGEILNANRHAKGHEVIEQRSIKVTLPKNTPGNRRFLAFRLGGSGKGKKSVFIGYRDEKVFYIVWIDPYGRLYIH